MRVKAVNAKTSSAKVSYISLIRGIKNTGFLFSGNAISALISFVITVYIARLLPVSEFGSYITVISFVTLFGVFTDFGINTVIIREGAKNPEDTHGLIWSSMGLEFLMSVGSMLAAIVFALLAPYSLEVKVLIIVESITLVMGGIGSLFSAVFNIYQEMKYISAIQIVERLTFASTAFIALILGFGIVGVIFATVIAAAVSLTLFFVKSRQIHFYRLNFRPILNYAILGPAIWFGIAGLLGTVWQRIDTLMISLLLNMEQVGLYTPAVNYIGIGDMAVIALTAAFFPVLSKAVHERGITKKELARYMGYFTIAAVVVTTVTFVIGGPLIVYVFGPKYTESIQYINVLIIGFAINLVAVPTALLLDSTNNQKVHVLNASYMAGANIGLNWILIPLIGALGAAWATTISKSLGVFLGIPISLYVLKKSGHL